jgi:hypothetical protein
MIHQLLGRIVYFHAMFIEAALSPMIPAPAGAPCCNHDDRTPQQWTAGALLPDTAWAALDDVAATMPAHNRPCPAASSDCCAVCHIIAAGACIAAGWADTEYRAYQGTPEPGRVRDCAQIAAVRIGQAFAAYRSAACPALQQLILVQRGRARPPTVDELPLTGELLALWACPARAHRRPVVSELNHCTSLGDIRRVREQGGLARDPHR